MNSSRFIVLPTCSICQDEDAGPDIITTLCGHVFHSNCIRQWDSSRRAQRQTTKCPSCNVDLQRPIASMNSRFVRIHSLTEKTINSSSTQPSNESAIQSQWEESKLELRKMKEALRQSTLEPEGLKRERDSLQLKVKLMERTIHDMEDKKKTVSHERQKERSQYLTSCNTQLLENKRLQAELEKLNDKYRNLQNDHDRLQGQITQKLTENEELQSFVSDFAREKERLETIEAELKNQLQDRLKQTQTLTAANQMYNRKLEESKKKINHLESQLGIPVVSSTSNRKSASVRHCSKFYPEAPKPSPIPTHVAVMTPKAKGKQPEQSAKASSQRVDKSPRHSSGSNRSKRTRTNSHNQGPQLIEIRSDSDDIVVNSPSSTPHISSSSPSSHHNNKAEENVILPSLFGNDSSKPLKQSISFSSSKNQKSIDQSDSRLFNPSRNSRSNPFIWSEKFVVMGTKIKHR